jgi:hypothetical protein
MSQNATPTFNARQVNDNWVLAGFTASYVLVYMLLGRQGYFYYAILVFGLVIILPLLSGAAESATTMDDIHAVTNRRLDELETAVAAHRVQAASSVDELQSAHDVTTRRLKELQVAVDAVRGGGDVEVV